MSGLTQMFLGCVVERGKARAAGLDDAAIVERLCIDCRKFTEHALIETVAADGGMEHTLTCRECGAQSPG